MWRICQYEKVKSSQSLAHTFLCIVYIEYTRVIGHVFWLFNCCVILMDILSMCGICSVTSNMLSFLALDLHIGRISQFCQGFCV